MRTRRCNNSWSTYLDAFLQSPPFADEYAGTQLQTGGDSVAVSILTNGKSKNAVGPGRRMLQFAIASFIDLICETVPETEREELRSVLCRAVVHSQLLPAVFLSDSFRLFRNAFRSRINGFISECSQGQPHASIQDVHLASEPSNFLYPSRYRADFEELEMIGKGGFGTVFRVQSRIDKCFYAIKKIPFSFESNYRVMKAVSEVRVLASLHHKNIIRYYSAWAELSKDEPYVPPSLNICEIRGSSVNLQGSTISKPMQLSGSFECVKEKDCHSLPENSGDIWNPSFSYFKSGYAQGKFWKKPPTASDSSDSKFSDAAGPLVNYKENARISTSNRSPCIDATMYVQMELCPYTLTDYLNRRNFDSMKCVCQQFNIAVMKQLMSAIDHIHSQGLIHRDIKPCNVFLRSRGREVMPRVLLGDFGLACYESCARSLFHDVTDFELERHSAGVGTSTYSAPEQLMSSDYDKTVDIYSAGIILFELYQPFSTAMERVESLSCLRKGTVPEDFLKCWPLEADLILSMCNADSHKRRLAPEVLHVLESLKEDELGLLRRQIRELEDMVKKKDITIKNLTKRVKRLKHLYKIRNDNVRY